MKRLRGGWVALLLLAGAVGASGQSGQDVLELARKKYDAVTDVDLKFIQTVRFPSSRVEQKISGALQMKKGNRYRLETEEMTIVTDGTTLWSFSRATNQVIVDRFSPEERGLSPERILSGAPGDFVPTLLGKEKVGGISCHLLRMTPGEDHSFIKSMRLWISESDHLTRKALVADANGKESLYTVTEIRVNTGIPDARFSYVPPDGAEVVDLR